MEGLVDKLGGSENTSKYTIEYLRIVAIGFPATIVGYVANAGIRSDGNPKMSMVTLLIGAKINMKQMAVLGALAMSCLLYTSPSPRD